MQFNFLHFFVGRYAKFCSVCETFFFPQKNVLVMRNVHYPVRSFTEGPLYILIKIAFKLKKNVFALLAGFF